MRKLNNISTIIGAGLIALASFSLFSCSEIKDGVNDIDSWAAVKDYTSSLKHPAMLHTDSDFTFVKAKIAAGEAPWANAYTHLQASSYAVSTWTASPVVLLARLDPTNWATTYPNDYANYTNLMKDAAAAYQLALRWKISGDAQYATAAVAILNSWASTCTGYIVNSSGAFIDPNEYLIAIQVYQLANAAEILRDYSGWSSANFSTFKTWITSVFYAPANKFLNYHNSASCALSYWLNWDLAQMTAILSIGILTDNNDKINQAIQYFKYGIGSGNIQNAVPYTYSDTDSNETLGQCQESGRDQGHATLCVALMSAFCQMAKNIGEDLWTYDSNKAWAMCEYVGKYNYGTTETGNTTDSWYLSNFAYSSSTFPYTMYTNCTGSSWTELSYEEHKTNKDTRGTVRPAWELVKRLSSDYGLTSVYANKWVSTMRQNSTRNYGDGGQGDYGPNSGGFDQLGWGSLMFAKE